MAKSLTAKDDPLRIAFVVHDYNRFGGHSRYVAELATRFSQHHEVHVFSNTVHAEEGNRIHFHKVPALRTTALATILTFAIPSFFQVSMDFDIVHIQGFCGPRGNVVTTHMCNEAWRRSIQRLDGGVSLRELITCVITSALERRLYGRAHNCQVIAISHRVARDVAGLYGCRAPMRTIYHGVDLDVFSPQTRRRYRCEVRQKLGIAEDETAFLFVGNLRKGARQCIQALARLKIGTLLVVSPSHNDALREIAERSNCGNRVKWLGFAQQVERYYAAADALLLPTPHDAFGLVVTEAMACGLPVIVSREAGASELIHHGVNGLLLGDLNDESLLAELMQSLQQDPTRAARLGCEARKTMEAFPWDAVAEQTMQVYRDAAKRGF